MPTDLKFQYMYVCEYFCCNSQDASKIVKKLKIYVLNLLVCEKTKWGSIEVEREAPKNLSQ